MSETADALREELRGYERSKNADRAKQVRDQLKSLGVETPTKASTENAKAAGASPSSKPTKRRAAKKSS